MGGKLHQPMGGQGVISMATAGRHHPMWMVPGVQFPTGYGQYCRFKSYMVPWTCRHEGNVDASTNPMANLLVGPKQTLVVLGPLPGLHLPTSPYVALHHIAALQIKKSL